MSEISEVRAREILDSRGNPTVEVEVLLESGALGRAAVPPARPPDRGRHWSCETATRGATGQGRHQGRRERQSDHRPEVEGMEATDQAGLDQLLLELDGTPEKKKLGANALLACPWPWPRRPRTRWPAPLPLPRRRERQDPASPMMNILNGGKHADNTVDLQEFMIMPLGPALQRRLRMAPRSSTRCGTY